MRCGDPFNHDEWPVISLATFVLGYVLLVLGILALIAAAWALWAWLA
jgi:hypothetical protein